MTIMTFLKRATGFSPTPFLNDVEDLMEKADDIIRTLRLGVHRPDTRIADLLPSEPRRTVQAVKSVVEQYLRSYTKTKNDLHSGVTGPATAEAKSLRDDDAKKWEWHYMQRDVADMLILGMGENNVGAYDTMVRQLQANPELSDEKARSSFRNNLHRVRARPYLDLLVNTWQEVYKTFGINENPVLLAQLCARAAAERRGWHRLSQEHLGEMLDADGVYKEGEHLGSEAFRFLVGEKWFEDRYGNETETPATASAAETSEIREQPMIVSERQAYAEIMAIAAARARGESAMPDAAPRTEELTAIVRRSRTRFVLLGEGMYWIDAMEAAYDRRDGSELPNLRELIERRHRRPDIIQAASVWSQEVWELRKEGENYQLRILENPGLETDSHRFVQQGGRTRVGEYVIHPIFALPYEPTNLTQREIVVDELHVHIPGVYQHLFGNRTPQELSPEDQQMGVHLPIVGQQAPMKLLHNMTGRPSRPYVIVPCRHDIEATGTAYAIGRRATGTSQTPAPRERGQGIDLNAQLYDDDPPAGQRQQSPTPDDQHAHVFDNAPQLPDIAALVQEFMGGGRRERIRPAPATNSAIDPENLGTAFAAAERGETVRGTIIEPAGVQPVVFDNLTIYDANGQPFRTYRRVVLDGALQEGSKTQAGWIQHYAGTQRQLPTFPLLHAMIEDLVRSGNPAKEQLLADLRAYWIATGTKPNYGRGVMIHDAGREPFELSCPFPEKSVWTKDLNEDGQQTLKALLMPRDLSSALQTLQTFSNVPPYFLVPDKKSRQDVPERAAFADVGLDRFYLYCNSLPDNDGRSRGVAIEYSASPPPSTGLLEF